MDLSNLIGKKAEALAADTPRMSKEDYAAMKQGERETLWLEVDSTAQAVLQSDEALRGFLDFTANCSPQRTANLLLLHKQNPEIRQVKTFEGWKEAGRSLRSNEHGYTFLLGQDYERDDGTQGKGYTIGKVFDISQTKGRQPEAPKTHFPEELLAALVSQSHVPLALSDNLPANVQAQYVPKSHTIYVKNDLDATAAFFSIAREQAHASFDIANGNYSRKEFSASAYCAAYVTGKKFGLDTSAFNFTKVCEMQGGEKEPKDMRLFLSDIKNAAYTVTQQVEQSFGEIEQQLAPDAFSTEEISAEKHSPTVEKATTNQKQQGTKAKSMVAKEAQR
ncbi:MAG: hypothetical protein RR087_02905 [Oscillospiraceae bacterium]